MAIPRINSYALPQVGDYAKNRVNWSLEVGQTALLVHDMQDYFCNFYGVANACLEQVIDNIVKLKKLCVELGVPIFYTAQPIQQTAQQRGLLTDMWGAGIDNAPEQASIIKRLTPTASDRVLTKWRYSAFYNNEFLIELAKRRIQQLIICGIYANIGCVTTATEAFMHNIQPFMISDAVADFSLTQHLQALDYVATKTGMVLSSQQVKQQLLKKD